MFNNKTEGFLDSLIEKYVAPEKKDFAKIILGMEHLQEKTVMEGFENIFSLQGRNGMHALYKEQGMVLGLKYLGKMESYRVNLLAAAITNNFTQVVRFLLENGIDVNDAGIILQNALEGYCSGASPLMLACKFGSLESVQILLDKGANILHVAQSGDGILIGVESLEVVKVILKVANEQENLGNLLKIRKNHLSSVYDDACINGRIEIVTELLKINNFQQYCDMRSFLHHARMAVWLFPKHAQEFENICNFLRPLQTAHVPIIDFDPLPDTSFLLKEKQVSDVWSTLFNEAFAPSLQRGKKEAIKLAIAEIYYILSTPEKSIPCLQFLNRELVAYHSGKTLKMTPCLDASTYQFKRINGLHYPFPDETYTGIKKEKSLPEFLILLLKKYNLAKNAYKWIGLIPEEFARKMFAEGDFILEESTGLTLFHGKLSHMLQYAIILYSMEHGDITLNYEIDGKIAKIQIQDILQTFADDLKLREIVLDIRYPETISFSDPFRLISLLMEKGSQWGCQFLADYLIDSFCKGIIKRFNACREIYNLTAMDMKLFSEQSDDFMVELFSDTPQSFEYAKHSALKNSTESSAKNPASFFYAKGESYAILSKEYHPHLEFTTNPFER